MLARKVKPLSFLPFPSNKIIEEEQVKPLLLQYLVINGTGSNLLLLLTMCLPLV